MCYFLNCQEFNEEVQTVLSSDEPRDTSPFQRVRVSDVPKTREQIMSKDTYLLAIWRPSEELNMMLNEGNWFRYITFFAVFDAQGCSD